MTSEVAVVAAAIFDSAGKQMSVTLNEFEGSSLKVGFGESNLATDATRRDTAPDCTRCSR
jgi:hypothetical protein